MTQARELLPCPFCGDRGPEITGDRRLLWVACTAGSDCLSHGPKHTSVNEAIDAWNTRPALSMGKLEWEGTALRYGGRFVGYVFYAAHMEGDSEGPWMSFLIKDDTRPDADDSCVPLGYAPTREVAEGDLIKAARSWLNLPPIKEG